MALTQREQRLMLIGMVDELLGQANVQRLAVVLETEDGFLVSFRVGFLTEQEVIDLDILIGGLDLTIAEETHAAMVKRGSIRLIRTMRYIAKPVTPKQDKEWNNSSKGGGKGGRKKGSKNKNRNTRRWNRGDIPPDWE